MWFKYTTCSERKRGFNRSTLFGPLIRLNHFPRGRGISLAYRHFWLLSTFDKHKSGPCPVACSSLLKKNNTDEKLEQTFFFYSRFAKFTARNTVKREAGRTKPKAGQVKDERGGNGEEKDK